MPKLSSKLTEEQWRQVAARRREGETLGALLTWINETYHVVMARSTVQDALIALGIKPTGAKMNVASIEQFGDQAQKFLKSYRPLPTIPKRLYATKLEDMGHNTPQPAIAGFSDCHYGAKIDKRVSGGLAEYNIDIARERLSRYRDLLLRFHQLDSITIDIPALNIFALGDDIEGHGAMFPTQALQLDESVLFQYMGFVEDVSRMLLDLLSRYPHINVYKVYGNHGRIAASAKESYGPDNLEIMAWEHIADRVRQQTDGEWSYTKNGTHALTGGMIDFYISRSFFMLVRIAGQVHYIRHGHRIGGVNRTYRGAMDNKLRMNSLLGYTIPYMWKAHLHEAQEMEGEIGGQIIQNSCFVGPSLLSVEMQAAAGSVPSQELYLAHPKHGLTHHHRMRLASIDEVRNAEVIDALVEQGGVEIIEEAA